MPSSTSSSDDSSTAARAAKRALIALAAVFVALNAIALGIWQALPLSKVSEGRYLAAVEDHLAMLRDSKGEKGRVILLGGSGVAFSISAESLSEQLDRPVYNGGIQASIGIRNLIDLYEPHLDPENDLIVLVPELELIASDARYSATWCDVVFLRKDWSNLTGRPRCVPHILHRTYQDIRHHISNTNATDPVYRRSGFNAVGDLTSHLGIESAPTDFGDYTMPDVTDAKLNSFKAYVQTNLIDKGFDVLYVPAAMPVAACEANRERISRIAASLGKLSYFEGAADEIDRFCLEHHLFFDGAGHLNREGRVIQTENVRNALAQVLADKASN
ncbi:MAG: hypothetical protein AAF687_00815 [Pseudomonadota bacterium]